jgi:hypothetical protein
MAAIQSAYVRAQRMLVTAVVLLACANCGRNEAKLRIYNDGPVSLEELTVLFPDDEVRFRDVAVRSATPYVTVKHGVGPYAAFKFVSKGVPVQQNVVDFVGWKPIKGAAFTYRVHLEVGVSQPFLRVIEIVKEDKTALSRN